jgi:hypothetical protein
MEVVLRVEIERPFIPGDGLLPSSQVPVGEGDADEQAGVVGAGGGGDGKLLQRPVVLMPREVIEPEGLVAFGQTGIDLQRAIRSAFRSGQALLGGIPKREIGLRSLPR